MDDWFARIEETAKLIQDGNEQAAQTAYDDACKTLGKAIQNTKRGKRLDDQRHDTLFTTDHLTEVDYIGVEDEDEEITMEFQGKEVLRSFGTKKSAAKYIEEIQDKVNGEKRMTAEDIAMVIAARQIADTIPGDKSRLVSKKIDPVTLKERADKLLASEPFKEFINENRDSSEILDDEDNIALDTKLLTDGHGGQLEKAFGATVRSRQDLQQLDKDLYKRYQTPVRGTFDSYDAFIESGKKDFLKGGTGKITEKDKKVAIHAARMLAAFELKQKGKVYDQTYFDRKAAEIYRSPQFQYMYRHDPNKLNLLTTGGFVGFGSAVNLHMDAIRQADEDNEERKVERRKVSGDIITVIKYGGAYGTVAQRKQKDGYYKGLQLFEDRYSFLGYAHYASPDALLDFKSAMNGKGIGKKRGSQLHFPEEKPALTEQNVTDLLTSSKKMIKHLNKYQEKADAKELKAELEKVIRTGEKYNNPPAFRDKKGKTADQQLEEYKTACAEEFQNAAFKFAKNYDTLQEKDYNARKDDMKKDLGGKPELTRFASKAAKQTRLKDTEHTEPALDEFIKKRGPKFRAMVDAANDYESDRDDPAKTMRLIDTIIDYQKGKETLTGSAGARFDNSMVLLANVTAGTSMEKYLDEQLAKVNKARGAKPGDKKFVTKNTYFEGFDADLEPQEKAEKEEAKQRGYGLI